MERILSNIGFAILFINILLYLIRFSRNNSAYKVFVIYLFIMGIIQTIMEYYASNGMNNLFLSNYYLFFQFVFLSGFYYYLFRKVNKNITSIILYTSLLVIIGLIIQYTVNTKLYFTFNTVGFLITSIILLVYSVLYFYEMLTNNLIFYYVNLGVFFYLISSSLIFASATSFLSLNNEMDRYVWEFNAVLFIVYQLLILWEWSLNFFPKRIKLIKW